MNLTEFLKFMFDFKQEVGTSHGRLMEGVRTVFTTTKQVEEHVTSATRNLAGEIAAFHDRFAQLDERLERLEAKGPDPEVIASLGRMAHRLDAIEGALVDRSNSAHPEANVAPILLRLEARLVALEESRLKGRTKSWGSRLPSAQGGRDVQVEDATAVARELSARYWAMGLPSDAAKVLAAQVVVALSLDQIVHFEGLDAEALAAATATELFGDPEACACFRFAPFLPLEALQEATAAGPVIVRDALPDFIPSATGRPAICPPSVRLAVRDLDGPAGSEEAQELASFLEASVPHSAVPNLAACLHALRVIAGGIDGLDPTSAWTTGWVLPVAKAHAIDIAAHAHLFVAGLPLGLKHDPRALWLLLNYSPADPVAA